MKRKAIERIKPKKPEGKGLTASLQELGEILILNIYQAKELLVRYCINYETGEHEYWKEQHGWRKGGILNALNEDWRDWEWRTYDDYPKLQGRDANRIKELIRHRAWNNSPWERINGLEHSYNSEIRERCETNRKIKLMNLMRKVPGRPKNLREWFFEQAAGEDYMFRNRETKEFVCTNCGEPSWPEEIKRQDGEKKIRHNDMVFCPSCGKLVQAKTRTDHIEQKWKSCYLIQPVDEDTSVLRIIEAKVGWDNGRHYVELGDEIRILLYKVYSNRKLKKTYMIYYEDSWDGWTKGNRKNLRAREGYLYPGEFGQILDGTTYSEATRVLEHLSKTGMELNYNRLVAGTGQMKGYAQKIEYLAKGRFWNLLRDTIGCTDYPGYPTQYYGPLDMREESIEGMFRIQDRQKINRIRDEHGGNRMVRWMQYSDETGQKISKETVQWMIKNEIEPSGIRGLEKYMSPQKIMNYIERQKKEQYAGMTAEAVLEEYKDYGGYESTEIKIDFNYIGPSDKWDERWGCAKKWLSARNKMLRLGSDPDHFYKILKVSADDAEHTSERIGNFTATFQTKDGLRYLLEGLNEHAAENVSFNPYEISHPIYKISGEGNCSLIVNGKKMSADVGQNLTIDTDRKIAYRADGTLSNTAVSGDYEDLFLQEGENEISITDGFNLKIIPNWRCL